MIDIRSATTADVAALVECHLTCWHEAYAELAPADYLAELENSQPARISYWTTKIANGEAPWLAVDDEAVIGIAHAGPTEDDDLRPGLTLFAIYLRAAYWGTGLGDRLHRTIGDQPTSLWVLPENARAVRFYRRHGFEPDGAEQLHPGLRRTIIRLVRPPSKTPDR
ncbi:GNAT family N-acetyltransferase [Microlunatus speluncae]|uniref:GNAT family N-acetyltransferase n=1 Tax=Microlunatus speluncae TaxID=2594267 RepID=UPI0012662DDA|nr:GNAT family N-acetyltransferase [Microlunatus speluncae]